MPKAPLATCLSLLLATLLACATAFACVRDDQARARLGELAGSQRELSQILLLKRLQSRPGRGRPAAYPTFRPAPHRGDPASADRGRGDRTAKSAG